MRSTPTYQAGLFRHSLLLLIATQVGNVATMVFQVVMMRALPVIEYGILAAMLSLVLIAGTPMEALRTAVAHQAALLARADRLGGVKALLLLWARRLAAFGLCLVLVGLLLSVKVVEWLQLPSVRPFLLTLVIMAGSMFMPLFAGVLQGTQRFRWMAIHGQIWGVTRVILAIFLLWFLGRTAMSGLWAQSIAVVASVGVGLIALRSLLKIPAKPGVDAVRDSTYFFMSLAVLSGYAVLMNADVTLVKRFFDPEAAGTFARAATIGRSIVFLPLPVAIAMFPKVVSLGVATAADRQILKRAILFTAVLIGAAGIVCSLAAGLIWRIFTGEVADAETLLLVRWIIWALAPLGLTFLLVNFELAQRRFRTSSSLILLAALYIVGVSIWHDSFAMVLTVLSVISVSSLLVMLTDVVRVMRRNQGRGE